MGLKTGSTLKTVLFVAMNVTKMSRLIGLDLIYYILSIFTLFYHSFVIFERCMTIISIFDALDKKPPPYWFTETSSRKCQAIYLLIQRRSHPLHPTPRHLGLIPLQLLHLLKTVTMSNRRKHLSLIHI